MSIHTHNININIKSTIFGIAILVRLKFIELHVYSLGSKEKL